jgi:hypothetical protein
MIEMEIDALSIQLDLRADARTVAAVRRRLKAAA